MNILRIISSILLVAEFTMAPINLWTGRTMANFTHFTGFAPRIATTIFAPVKLIGAVLIAIGFIWPGFAIIGALILGLICLVYLIRLSSPARRDPAGIAAFAIGLVCAVIIVIASR